MYAKETKVKMFIILSNIKNEKIKLRALSTTLGAHKVRLNLRSIMINNVGNVLRAIMQMVEDMAKTNVHIDGPKWVMQEDHIQVIFVFQKLFFKHVIRKNILKIHGTFNPFALKSRTCIRFLKFL